MPPVKSGKKLTAGQILAWADGHHRRAGRWPRATDGPIADAPGETWRFRVRVTRKTRTRDGQRLTEKVVVRSGRDGDRSDVVWFRVRAR